MRSVHVLDSDVTAKARIRDTAMRLFAAHGVAATSLRAVAKEAAVSPGLVVHHFGGKEGLCRAVDEAVVQRIELALSEVPLEGSGAEIVDARAEVVFGLLRNQPVLCDYMARALSEGTEASGALFHRLFSSARRDARLAEAGVIREDADPFWRAMQQLVLVVGPLMLRPLIEDELGGPLLERPHFERWMRANTDLLRHGLYTGD
jgi:TetR/AcrR family transcriptional regulator, regulator of cefoperazone and chloramphenicol sensitivity